MPRLLDAQTPRVLEEATATLLGAEMHIALQTGIGLFFDRWFEEVVEAAASAAVAGLLNADDTWQAPFRLLHGLAAIGPSGLGAGAAASLTELRTQLTRAGSATPTEPAWLSQVEKITPTGEVWQLRDAYGGRHAVIARYAYPDHAEQYIYLFDIDLCGLAMLTHGGVFDDVHNAAAAWRTLAGSAADHAVLEPVRDSDQLQSLVYVSVGGEYIHGFESRAVMDNWFRARRRIDDLSEVLHRRGTPLPPKRSLYHDVNIEPAVTAFTQWHYQRYGQRPDPRFVVALAVQWLEGTVPGAEHVASPHRAEFQLHLIGDWIDDDPVTIGAKALLPDWMRWNGEQSGLAPPLIEAAVAVAAGRPRASTDCPQAP